MISQVSRSIIQQTTAFPLIQGGIVLYDVYPNQSTNEIQLSLPSIPISSNEPYLFHSLLMLIESTFNPGFRFHEIPSILRLRHYTFRCFHS